MTIPLLPARGDPLGRVDPGIAPLVVGVIQTAQALTIFLTQSPPDRVT